MTKEKSGNNQAEELQNQLNQALKELDQIRKTQLTITDPDALQAIERAILKATDKIAALLCVQTMRQSALLAELKASLYLHAM